MENVLDEELVQRELMMDHLFKAAKVLDDRGYKVLYIGYYGAHNYNLNDRDSDYDFKAIVIPTLEQTIRRVVISTTIECEWGNIDVKDLLTFTTNMNKGNFSYIEALQTNYCVDNGEMLLGISVKDLFKDVKINWMSMVGAIYEKRKALTHEYPSKSSEFEQFGCDPKQFMQAIRLFDILRRRSLNPENYNKAYEVYTDDGIQFELTEFESESSSRRYEFTRQDLIDLKRRLVMPLDETIRIFDYIQIKAREFIPKDYKFEPTDFTDKVIDLLVNYFIGSCMPCC